MTTPICDFVKKYSQSNITRFHMPGHKGVNQLGFEEFDITEINGADSLFSCDGIIKESEENATRLFGTEKTVYSTAGSTLCIQAMLHLTLTYFNYKSPTIIAARNVHKAFVNACALLGINVKWVYPQKSCSICECKINVDEIEDKLKNTNDCIGVYITSPDYLGNIADIKGISKIRKKYSVPLLVDNAHGAYLKFLKPSLHPIDLGADICCDSAHKTLPVLTSGAYLHIVKDSSFTEHFSVNAKSSMALFASTSPSYLTLCSLDYCNLLLEEEFSQKLEIIADEVENSKEFIRNSGYKVVSDEPLKITILPNENGRTGIELADFFRENGYECEYADFSSVVLMLSPYNKPGQLSKLVALLKTLPMPRKFVKPLEIDFSKLCCESKMSIREASLAKCRLVNSQDATGLICAKPVILCPPGVPVCISGEVITEECIKYLLAYNITQIEVVDQSI